MNAVEQRRTRRFLPELQALRAIAVGLVVAFHVAPTGLFRGGFVGVDAFFVISGYLITDHLLREVDRSGTIRLSSFYARRARRLLPASMLVLVVLLIGSILVLPQRYLLGTIREVIASTFYVQNLWLASQAVTYSASNDLASPAQHYWSLSTEEQFYFVWPALILLGLYLARRYFRGHTVRTIGWVLVALTTASLIHSIALTNSDQAMAYFLTTTRAWEFGAGALVSLLLRRWTPLRGLPVFLRWLGVVLLFGTAVLISQATPFPGWIAAIPVVGTAMIIVAGDTGRRDPLTRVFGLRPVQWLGNVSYAVYLWHWPLLVLMPYAVGHTLSWWEKGLVLVATGVLAHLTRFYVEIPAQRNQWWGKRTRRTLVVVFAAMALIAGTAFGAGRVAESGQQSATAALEARLDNEPCIGAKAPLNDQCADPFGQPAMSTVSEAEAPWGDPCSHGGCDPNLVRLKVALVGDSHAESLYPALKVIAQNRGWEVRGHFQGGCPATYATTPSFKHGPRDTNRQCTDWAHRVTEELRRDQVDMIITTASVLTDWYSTGSAIAGFQAVWRDWEQIAPVTVIRDYPGTGGQHMPSCLASSQNQLDCAVPRAEALLPRDLQYEAAATFGSDRVHRLELTEAFCDDRLCYPVIGGLPVYYDEDHITKSFSRTLAPLLEAKLPMP
ncbi:acyltransferase family protein [Granulicoccus phenolivorans]|uniref:acyltransferase family protein n=1 Tax=Granulicoccus phenolivorans TaxID=266854 RepID=UPI0004110CC5|nr:acyltransferase family protein [Granulicoccus phenolivorans]